MSLSREVVMDLMAYADGELDDRDRKRVEALIASSEDARRLVQSMGDLGRVVTRIYEAPASAAYAGIADAVMASVAAEPAAAARPANVVDLESARKKRATIGAALLAAVSIAAGVAFMMRHAGVGDRGEVASAPTNTASPGASPAATKKDSSGGGDQVASAAGVDVEQVDSSHEVEVYYVPTAGGNASSVVVWIDDKGASLQ